VSFLLSLSRLIDAINGRIGRSVMWLVLIAVLISAGNALVRKIFHTSSNAFLEIQWYLFGAIFLLSGGYTFLRNDHVRIDVISSRLSAKGRNIIDIVGIVLFMLPMAGLILWLSWTPFMLSFQSGEISANAGGLVRWPARLIIPVGFLLLILQAVSELIKRVAFLMDLIPDPLDRRGGPSAEDELAAVIKAKAEGGAK
jgi:TRAP-type mannitol/chloroaromatic compound transport system permease small subunit